MQIEKFFLVFFFNKIRGCGSIAIKIFCRLADQRSPTLAVNFAGIRRNDSIMPTIRPKAA
jgi:hypothetical protein